MLPAPQKISCICITRHRPHLLKRAMACFHAQTHPDKELVVLCEEDDAATLRLLDGLPASGELKILIVPRETGRHLGYLRNYAIARASGNYICQWDDDDWYHPERLRYQLSLIEGTHYAACVLSRELIFDTRSGTAWLSCQRHWEGSVLCRREEALEYPYSNLEKGEDTPMILSLQRQRLLYTDPASTPFYIYIFHGENTWDYDHFKGFFPYSTQLPAAVAQLVGRITDGETSDAKDIEALDDLFRQTIPA